MTWLSRRERRSLKDCFTAEPISLLVPPKIGKSFFMSQLGYHVATGTPLWDYPVRQGSVLYLALEDDYGRLQGRLNQMFGVEAVDGLHFATKARTLADGMNGQLEEFLQCHPDTRLIIVDTLQKVRELCTVPLHPLCSPQLGIWKC